MNSNKPLPDESDQAQTHTDLAPDAIPVLNEALDLPAELVEHETVLASAPYESEADVLDTPAETNPAMDQYSLSASQNLELSVNLGYAEEREEYVEHDDLAEMDEIQTLPLAEMIMDDSQDSLVSAEQKRQIATLEAIVFEGENPNAPAPKNLPLEDELIPEQGAAFAPEDAEPYPETSSHTIPAFTPPPPGKPLPTKSDNPFLPQHILDRLNQGKRNLVEEIAQSSAALDASTAILRTHARAERLAKPAYSDAKPQYSFSRDKSAQQKQKMVDDLVEEYLPLLAAELRRRLRKILDE
ncbi:MAG: hypothetical protein NVV73_09785 [Cellvibrionaceae bacterium]|nr:hypothetical protein [Cellvibrionaceae bacterium]